ncbi:dethiobiotin synthase [Methylocapsa palsarum]|uniref:ATP-dependent dethiobiotin synthetase BioD n=1 Tax=Methylocapsa palsarum TaxID=1612308 RepID=A0A1I4AE64_9HYPH|nr:dethiobiotin synthase [Methylocapsa palsarum]SFK54470.1 dethiobiotin synthetase [Methylocapsa palsarum]
MPAIFVTGAGTNVGKTFVTAGLIRNLRASGRAVDALKPIVSGFDPLMPRGSDPALLLEALGRDVTPQTLAALSPWRFREPLSPDMAARAEGRSIVFEEVVRFCAEAVAQAPGLLLIEGVGGVMVPIGERRTLLDVMTRLRLPLILVGGSYLGAINHLLTAEDVLRSRGLDLRAIVVSESQDSVVGLGATEATLADFVTAPLLALRRGGGQNERAFARLSDLL